MATFKCLVLLGVFGGIAVSPTEAQTCADGSNVAASGCCAATNKCPPCNYFSSESNSGNGDTTCKVRNLDTGTVVVVVGCRAL